MPTVTDIVAVSAAGSLAASVSLLSAAAKTAGAPVPATGEANPQILARRTLDLLISL